MKVADKADSNSVGGFLRVGSSPTRSTILQGREEVTHQTHTLETAGSIPAPAPIWAF